MALILQELGNVGCSLPAKGGIADVVLVGFRLVEAAERLGLVGGSELRLHFEIQDAMQIYGLLSDSLWSMAVCVESSQFQNGLYYSPRRATSVHGPT